MQAQSLPQVPEEMIVTWIDSDYEEIKDPFLSCVLCLWSSRAGVAARACCGHAQSTSCGWPGRQEEPTFVIPHVGRKLAELGLHHAGICHVGLSRGTVTITFPLRSRGLLDKGEGPG